MTGVFRKMQKTGLIHKIPGAIRNLPAGMARLYRRMGLYALAAAMSTGYAQAAYAQFDAICKFINWNMVGGGIVPAVASLAVIMLGIGATLGKVSWGMAFMVSTGIGVMFGSYFIVGMFSGQSCLDYLA